MNEWFTIENIEHVAAEYRTFGPLIGLLLPFIEAFLPFFTIGRICCSKCKCVWLMVWFFYCHGLAQRLARM